MLDSALGPDDEGALVSELVDSLPYRAWWARLGSWKHSSLQPFLGILFLILGIVLSALTWTWWLPLVVWMTLTNSPVGFGSQPMIPILPPIFVGVLLELSYVFFKSGWEQEWEDYDKTVYVQERLSDGSTSDAIARDWPEAYRYTLFGRLYTLGSLAVDFSPLAMGIFLAFAVNSTVGVAVNPDGFGVELEWILPQNLLWAGRVLWVMIALLVAKSTFLFGLSSAEAQRAQIDRQVRAALEGGRR